LFQMCRRSPFHHLLTLRPHNGAHRAPIAHLEVRHGHRRVT
jgi:hypothetical protein